MKKRLFLTLVAALLMPFVMNAQQKTLHVLDTTVCGTFTWSANGQEYSTSGLYTYVDSTERYVLNLDVRTNYAIDTTVNGVCTYKFNNVTYYRDTTVQHNFHTRIGNCDSIVTLHLNVTDQVSASYVISACKSYYWEAANDTLKRDTVVTNFLLVDSIKISNNNYKRCDSVLSLDLSILTPTLKVSDIDTISGCDGVQFRMFPADEPWSTLPGKGWFRQDTLINTDTRYSQFVNGNVNKLWEKFHQRGTTPETCFDSTKYVQILVPKSHKDTANIKACDFYRFDTSYTTSEIVTRYNLDTIFTYDTVRDAQGNILNVNTFTSYDTLGSYIDTVFTDHNINQLYTYSVSNEGYQVGVIANGCADSLFLNITMNTSPYVYIDGDINLNPGNNGTTLYAVCDQNVTYKWLPGNTTADSLVLPALSQNTDITIIATNPTTTCKDTNMVTVTVNEGILNADNQMVSLYPNPANQVVTVCCEEAMDNIAIYNTLGQRVMNTYDKAANTTLNVSSLPNGTYTVRLQTKSGKVMVQNIVIAR